jgi:Uma2 family endonuclease
MDFEEVLNQENGLHLGWLLDPETQRVEIYRCDRIVKILENSGQLSGEDILSGFVLNLMGILLD